MLIRDGKILIYDLNIDVMREIGPDDVQALENQAVGLSFLITRLRTLLERTLLVGQGKASVSDFPE
jgi:hypothetical protein